MSSNSNSNVGISLTALATGTAAPNVNSNTNLFISPTTFYSQITTATATNAAYTLPLNPILGQTYTIRNDSADSVSIFAPTSTSSINIIGGGGFTSCLLASGSMSFIAVSNNGAANLATGANPYNNPAIIYHQISNTGSSTGSTVVVGQGATVNLSASQSGATFIMNPVTNGQTINLPAVNTANGVTYKFISLTANPGFNYTLTPTTAVLNGVVIGAATLVACANKATLATVTANILAGDSVSLTCDGTNWYVLAQAHTAGAFA